LVSATEFLVLNDGTTTRQHVLAELMADLHKLVEEYEQGQAQRDPKEWTR
jgi:hypothetical protein